MANHTLERADGERRVLGGYRYVEPKADAKRFTAKRASASALPPKVDLRPFMTEVENQGQTNSCAANATAGAYEYLMKRHQGDDAYDVSRMFIYYNARAAGGDAIEDEGSVLQLVIDSLKEQGACSEATWPFDVDLVNDEPDQDSYDEASGFLIDGCELVPTELDAWKGALAEGNPIIFGIMLFDSFDKQRKPGLVPAPTKSEAGRESHGGHAMLCVGYSDADKVFIVRNSWGTEWGDQGYCYMPYSYVMDPEQNFGDSWIIKSLEVLEAEEDDEEIGWGDDESVLTEVGDFIGETTDEEWEELIDAMGDHPLERRLALLFLAVIGADGDVADEELEAAAEFLQPVLEAVGSKMKPEKLLAKTVDFLDADLVTESVELLGEHLPTEVLASIASQLEEAATADEDEDEIATDELDVLEAIVSAWQLEEELEEDEEEEQEEGRRGFLGRVVDAVVDALDDEDEEDDEEDDEEEEEDDEEYEDEEEDE